MVKLGRSSTDQPILIPALTGKQWHTAKSAFRPNAGQTTYEKRLAERKAQAITKAKEREMKEEKEEERQVRYS